MTKLHLGVSPLLLPISLKMKILNINLLDFIVSLEHEVSLKAKSAVTPTMCVPMYLFICSETFFPCHHVCLHHELAWLWFLVIWMFFPKCSFSMHISIYVCVFVMDQDNDWQCYPSHDPLYAWLPGIKLKLKPWCSFQWIIIDRVLAKAPDYTVICCYRCLIRFFILLV